MKELLLRGLLAGHEVDVVYDQDVEMPIPLPERLHLVGAEGKDELVEGKPVEKAIGKVTVSLFKAKLKSRLK